MNVSAGIIISALILAVTAGVMHRWDFQAGQAGVLRMDRWTGIVYRCTNSPTSTSSKMVCE